MCQIMFYNQLPTTDTIHKWTLPPEVGRFHIGAQRCGIRTLGWTPIVRLWNQCGKPCFIINCQLLTQFTSGPWLQKWAGSTSVPSLMWNPDTGADTKCPAKEPMCQIMFYNQPSTSDTIHKWTLCQIMFYNQLPTSDTIHKWTLAPELDGFNIGAITDMEPRTMGWTASVRIWN